MDDPRFLEHLTVLKALTRKGGIPVAIFRASSF